MCRWAKASAIKQFSQLLYGPNDTAQICVPHVTFIRLLGLVEPRPEERVPYNVYLTETHSTRSGTPKNSHLRKIFFKIFLRLMLHF
ncbi:hypothetical protein WN51_14221 [Melipona quadrifasciata]|uniref:Uncharacterized protein n=1 Tax=Melipona quadrifasciata TaxID=166423 RepID=A0A0N0BG69_9HYME|nr:hypothetical protein WN51_14221 [Melipona quadrifasciata]